MLLTASIAAAEIVIDRGLVSIDVHDVPLQAVLDELAAQNGLDLVQQQPVSRRVSLRLREQPLSKVLEALLDTGDSYQLILPAEASGGESRPLKPLLWVFGAAPGDAYFVDFHGTVLLRGGVADRKASIRALRDLGTPEAIREISLALGDDDPRVRDAAMAALAGVGSDDALAALGGTVSGGDAGERAAAAEALALAESPSAARYLDIALSDDDPRVRAAAAYALEDLDADTARTRLKAALVDPDPDVRERALDVLEALDDEAMFHAVFPPK